MKAQTITLETSGGPMPLYVAGADADPKRAAVVFQEAFGVNDHIEDVTRRFAAEGYLAVAPHLFHRTLDGCLPYGDITAIRPHMTAVTDEGMLDDLDATLGYLAESGIDAAHTGVVGFCLGGRQSFVASVRRALGAGVTFYGGGIVSGRTKGMPAMIDSVGQLRTPWLGLFGDLDQGIPVEEVEHLRAALKAGAKVDTEIVRYANAGHGFHCDAREANYVEDAARDGWRRTLAWFDRYLG